MCEHFSGDELLHFLVTAKTYPTPSVKYMETVCTAGITRDGRWIRLYPVPFRYWESRQRYRLYDWVKVPARRRPASKDKRKESHEPAGDLQVVGHIGTDHNWRERKRIILPHVASSLESLLRDYRRDGTSLGAVRPAEVKDVLVRRDEAQWSPAQRKLLDQLVLYGQQPKRLEKPDHRFLYRFTCCDTTCPGHELQIVDWGLSVLYLRERKRNSEAAAVEKTRAKCWELARADKDTYFFVGTRFPYASFMVLGVFYPRKERPDGRIQMELP